MVKQKDSTFGQIIGRVVLVNDLDGDAFHGVCLKVDEHGLILIGSGVDKVEFLRPDQEPLPLENFVHVPISRVKFVQVIR